MSSQRIVQISSVHPSNDTRIFHKICKSLVKNGFDVDLIIQHSRDEIINGVNIISLPIAKSKIDRPLKIIPVLISKCLKYPKSTIFQFHDSELIPIGILLKLRGYKVIYDVHEDVPEDVLTKKWIPRLLRNAISIVVEKIEKSSSKYFDAIITVVPSISNRFESYSKNVYEIRNYPLISELTSKQVVTEKKYAIYVGSLTTRRGLPKLVDAMGLLNDKEIELWLGGNFAEPGLEKLLKSKPGWEKTKYLGWVNFEEIEKFLNNAICGLLTLEIIPTHNESLSVKMFEYMLAEIPVLSTDLTFPKQVILENECGKVITEHSPENIAEAIRWFLNNPEESKQMGKNGRDAVLNKYSWKQEEVKLINLIENL